MLRPHLFVGIARFWRTIEEDMIEGTTFENLEEFEKDLYEYMIYYNEYRPHQGLDGKIPAVFNKEFTVNDK